MPQQLTWPPLPTSQPAYSPRETNVAPAKVEMALGELLAVVIPSAS